MNMEDMLLGEGSTGLESREGGAEVHPDVVLAAQGELEKIRPLLAYATGLPRRKRACCAVILAASHLALGAQPEDHGERQA